MNAQLAIPAVLSIPAQAMGAAYDLRISVRAGIFSFPSGRMLNTIGRSCPPLKRMFKINTTPFTDAQRKRLHPQKVKPFAPTVQKVKEIVPNKIDADALVTSSRLRRVGWA